jgi:hypothetical protein
MMLNPAALYDFFPDQLDLRRIEFASALFLEAICDILVMKRDEEEGRSKFKSHPPGIMMAQVKSHHLLTGAQRYLCYFYYQSDGQEVML